MKALPIRIYEPVRVFSADPVWRSRRGNLPGVRSTAAGRKGPRGGCSTSGDFWNCAPTRGPGWSGHTWHDNVLQPNIQEDPFETALSRVSRLDQRSSCSWTAASCCRLMTKKHKWWTLMRNIQANHSHSSVNFSFYSSSHLWKPCRFSTINLWTSTSCKTLLITALFSWDWTQQWDVTRTDWLQPQKNHPSEVRGLNIKELRVPESARALLIDKPCKHEMCHHSGWKSPKKLQARMCWNSGFNKCTLLQRVIQNRLEDSSGCEKEVKVSL